MDTQTIILLSVGFLTLAAMVYFIVKSNPPSVITPLPSPKTVDDEESNYTTVNESGDESIFDS